MCKTCQHFGINFANLLFVYYIFNFSKNSHLYNFLCFSQINFEVNMITLICFVIAMLGGINWLSIGLIQFDFIAGIFGSQAHVVSRMFYVLFGFACAYLIYKAIATKGKLEFRREKFKKESETQQDMLG